MTIRTKELHKYFVVEGDGRITGFDIDACEYCGRECEAANAIGYVETPERLKSLGMTERERRLPELGYSDELGGAVCPDCYERGVELAAEQKTKEEEHMVTETKEKQVQEKAAETWGKFTHPQRIAVILESHTFPAVLKKDWKDISPKLQTRLLGSFKAALTAKAPEAPKVAPVESNKEPEETLSDEIKDITVTVVEKPIGLTDEEAKILATPKMVTPNPKPTKRGRKPKQEAVVAV